MTVQLDSFTIKDLESRYGVARSNIYNRINGLKEKGYSMEPEKQSGKSIFDADQVAVMDALDAHLKADNDIASFPNAAGQATLSYVLQDKPQVSRRTQDTPTFGLTDFPEAIALRVATLLQPPTPPADPFANLKALEEAAQRGWLLSSSQLAPLLGVKSLHGKAIRRYGFTCTRTGKNGAESAWLIQKQPLIRHEN